ncbi:hypothetical protein [Bacillus gaemokensis]|uniref:Uncharacterized protein n=1 Tax=Bacillus gaemokensis TaxID=574375 RepID=A0A073KB08_9BACI|nr:hypothetical protein [Bacillus gaemokensis]KEK23647.1 hypothetical protein BAGA_07935 [Bacillus gaemokensis]KYG26439.1 hypothetical protein AZF08_16760 [Bacillus gaemokensis]
MELNRFHTLEYKFANEEVLKEMEESFTYNAITYISGIENGEKSEMQLSYKVKVVKEDNTFKIAKQWQHVK